MITISNQQSQVAHTFVQQQSRTVSAGLDTEPNARRNPDTQTNPGPAPSLDRVDLTPEQIVKQRLIDSLSSEKPSVRPQDTLNDIFNAFSQVDRSFGQTAFVLIQQSPSAEALAVVTESLYEFESLDYATSLTFSNQAGEQIDASLALQFERELSVERQLTVAVGELKDPLIVNLTGQAALLAPGTTQFDVDSDGELDGIPELNRGVYFLALDRDQNGHIDNGIELFGARTGDGFTELAAFDEDVNGLIDERDSAYQQLQLWDGRNRLTSLSQSGVSAISLNAQHTPYAFTDNTGNPRAHLRQTAVFINNQDALGAVHQVDFVV